MSSLKIITATSKVDKNFNLSLSCNFINQEESDFLISRKTTCYLVYQTSSYIWNSDCIDFGSLIIFEIKVETNTYNFMLSL